MPIAQQKGLPFGGRPDALRDGKKRFSF